MTRHLAALASSSAVAVMLMPAPVVAQETKLGADFRLQRARLAEKCGAFAVKPLVGCATTIITDHPFHLAIGSLAPGNGFGFGLAFVAPQSKPNDDWRINWSTDAVGTPLGAWRGGVYAKFVRSHVGGVGVTGPGGGTASSDAMPRPYPTLTAYGQVTSLPRLSYFGEGNDTKTADRAAFAMRQSTLGTRVVWPLGRSGFWNRLNPIALGEANGRWTHLAASTATADPSIEVLFSDATAPGLTTTPTTLQLGEGLRIAPAIGRLQLVYTGELQQFVASDSSLSFRRWTIDLRHELSLWTASRQGDAREQNGPNDCATDVSRTVGAYGCPDPTLVTTNRVGTVGVRALLSRSDAASGSRVPFYFQRTIGGSDIDGERLLSSYADYRFRGPNLIILQATIEQAIWGPVGAFAMAEQGRVARDGESLTSGGLKHTFGAGVTLRAGGVPMMTAWWATGGPEGHHVAITMNASLLGGSPRPSLR